MPPTRFFYTQGEREGGKERGCPGILLFWVDFLVVVEPSDCGTFCGIFQLKAQARVVGSGSKGSGSKGGGSY